MKRNEIDIVECKVDHSNPTLDNHIFLYPVGCADPDGYEFNATAYSSWQQTHTFKCIYAPDRIEYWVDNTLLHTVLNIGDDEYPDQLMRILLIQQVVKSNDQASEIITPQTSTFNWVRAKEFFLAPEIDCSDILCSSETAILDVVSEATNITWALTPTNLFSGSTTGTGKTASISAASRVSGEGKITYSFDIGDETFTAEEKFWAGDPDPDDFYIVGLDNYGSSVGSDNSFEVCENNYYTFYLYPVCNLSENHHRYGITDVDFFFDFDYTIVNEGYGWAYVYVNNIDGNSTGLVDADACNYLDEFLVYDLDEGYCGRQLLILSPNPASAEVSIAIETDNNTDAGLKSASTEPTFDQTTEWEYEVYSTMQSLKAKKTKIRGKSTTLNIQSWKEGVYTVRAKYKGEVLTGKLVVKK